MVRKARTLCAGADLSRCQIRPLAKKKGTKVSLEINKLKDRCCIPAFLTYVRSLPCCVCGKPATASHMISIKRADGSDALAVPACMPEHHVSSTRTSREILERNGIDIPELHRNLWRGFLWSQGIHFIGRIYFVGKDEFAKTQEAFEAICRVRGLVAIPPTKRRANFR